VFYVMQHFSFWLNKEQSNLSKYNWLCSVLPYTSRSWIDILKVEVLIPMVLVPLDKFSLCHTSIKPDSLAFQDLSFLLIGDVTTWSQGLHQLVLELKSKIGSYLFENFVLFVFHKFSCVFLVLFSLYFWHLSTRKKVLFCFVTVPKHISNIKSKKKKPQSIEKPNQTILKSL
jgi:hypothetical protein